MKPYLLTGLRYSSKVKVNINSPFNQRLSLKKENDHYESLLSLTGQALGDDTDFSSLRSLQIIEKFLISLSEDVQMR